MPTSPLSPNLTRAVLNYLQVSPAAPDSVFLDALVAAYVRRVPWESVSRIVKRQRESDTARCARWPQEFWQDAMTQGTGGTCFETNYAFLALLRALGFEGYLTINDMDLLTGCHSALVIMIGEQRWLVDVGLPLYVPVPLAESDRSSRSSAFHTYRATPCGDCCYQIERDRHGRRYCYTLVDIPVSDSAYRAAVSADYGRSGLFLDRVIITRVCEGRIWRFHSQQGVGVLESFVNGGRTEHALGSDPVATIAQRFQMTPALIAAALAKAG
ncbi:MAG: arylamine N-acetyltransferase [Chloroflexi bacterium]|nr:arylamine N-acetyltransferase [Chloroflexota bacterium]